MLIRYLREMFPHVESEDPVSYLNEAGDAINALMYSFLYWPHLVEVYGAVFVALSGNDELEIRERLTATAGSAIPNRPDLSWSQVVDSYNIFEIGYLFRSAAAAAGDSDSLHHELGAVLVKSWSARLSEGFPQRQYSVRLAEADESVMGLRIEVEQVYPALTTPCGWNGQLRKVVRT